MRLSRQRQSEDDTGWMEEYGKTSPVISVPEVVAGRASTRSTGDVQLIYLADDHHWRRGDYVKTSGREPPDCGFRQWEAQGIFEQVCFLGSEGLRRKGGSTGQGERLCQQGHAIELRFPSGTGAVQVEAQAGTETGFESHPAMGKRLPS